MLKRNSNSTWLGKANPSQLVVCKTWFYLFLQPALTRPTRVGCPLHRRCLVNNSHLNHIHSTLAPTTSTRSNCPMGEGGGVVMVTTVLWPGLEPPPTSTPQPSMRRLQGCQGLESRLTTSCSEVGKNVKFNWTSFFYKLYTTTRGP